MTFDSIITDLQTSLNNIQGQGPSQDDIDAIKKVNNHVQALESSVQAINNAKSKITGANRNIGEHNSLVEKESSKLENKIRNSKRIIQMSNYEYERNNEFKNMFKRMSYICLGILIIVFLQRQFSFLKMPGNFIIIGLGVYLVIFVIERTIFNFNRYNINYHELHKAHSEQPK